jgi:tetratricopeptide (TPR) repeat protein
VRAVDFYVVAMGQLQSETLRPGILAFLHSGLSEERDQLNFLDKEFIAHAADLVAITDAARANQPRRVLDIYERLPESLKRTKSLLNVRLISAAKISQQDYLRAFNDFRKYHSDAAECDLIALNVFYVQRSYEQALASVDRLDKSLGGDPYLKVTRAVILLDQGKADTARQMAERAIAEDPTLIQAYEFLISHSIQTRNFAKTAEILSTLESRFNWKVPDFTADPACAEFVKSEAYKAWIKSHGQRRAVPSTK